MKYLLFLKYILNISIAKGVIPDKLKKAWVTPVFKKGDNTLVTNYRQISFFSSKNYFNA